MKLAAAKAIAKLAKDPVPEIVTKAYGESNLSFGRFYLIPKPVDPRLITTIAPAVAKAAIESGVAKKIITDWEAYEVELQKRIGIDERLMSIVIGRAKKDPKRVVFGEADNLKILKAAQLIRDEKIAIPILLGNRERILELIEENSLDLEGVTIIDPLEEHKLNEKFGKILAQKRQRKGMTLPGANRLVRERNYFGALMVETGEADAFISGLTRDYPKNHPSFPSNHWREKRSQSCSRHVYLEHATRSLFLCRRNGQSQSYRRRTRGHYWTHRYSSEVF